MGVGWRSLHLLFYSSFGKNSFCFHPAAPRRSCKHREQDTSINLSIGSNLDKNQSRLFSQDFPCSTYRRVETLLLIRLCSKICYEWDEEGKSFKARSLGRRMSVDGTFKLMSWGLRKFLRILISFWYFYTLENFIQKKLLLRIYKTKQNLQKFLGKQSYLKLGS